MTSHRKAIIVLYVVSMFMVSIDGTIVNVILPVIAADFGVAEHRTNGINIAYLVSIAVSLPASGYLADRFGVKKMLLAGVGAFTLASLLCGLASSLIMLITARALQGLAGGLIAPVGMALLFRTFPPEQRKKLAGSLVLPIAFAPAIGPLAGGVIAEYLSWEWSFFINIPIGIAALSVGSVAIKEFERYRPSFDWKGYALIGGGLPAVMASMSLFASGRLTWMTVLLAGAGLALLGGFCLYGQKAKEPLLDVHLYKDNLFRSLSIVAMCSMGAIMGMLYLFPLFYQTAYSASPLESALITFTEALGLMAASRLIPKTAKRFTMKATIQGGLLGTIIIFIFILMLGPSADPWLLRSLMFGVGIFLGHSVIGSQVTAFNHVTKKAMGKATTLYNMMNRVGAATGIASAAAILAASSHFGIAVSYRVAFAGTILFLAAGLLSAMYMREEPAPLKGKAA